MGDCTLDELDAYHRGALPADRQDSVAEHLAACDDCSILLLYAVIGPGGNGDRDESFEADTKEAWNRLRPYLRNGSEKERPLANLLAEDRLPLEEALDLALKISQALTILHSRGRLLQDLRAENVLIDLSRQVRLPDLGLSPTPESLEVGYGRPAENAMADLYRSLSPEQVVREGLDHRSNLFSLGVLLYEMLTGVSPFRDSTPLGTASRILSLDPPPVIELNSDVKPAVSELIARLLAKEPEDRPQSAAAVTRELQALMVGADGSQVRLEDAELVDLEGEIDRLYDRIIVLTQAEAAESESNRSEEIERAYARLLELQKAEAKRFRQRWEASLEMPIDAGERILARARALRKDLEDIASPNSAYQLDDPRKVERRRARQELMADRLNLVARLEDEIADLLRLADAARRCDVRRFTEILKEIRALQDDTRRALKDLKRYAAVPQDAPWLCRCPPPYDHSLPEELERQTIDIPD